jgi:hypothetical protein
LTVYRRFDIILLRSYRLSSGAREDQDFLMCISFVDVLIVVSNSITFSLLFAL